MRAKIGDFVTATLVGKKNSIQGVFVKDNEDGTMIVQGKIGRYLCFGPRNVTVVPDEKLGEDKDFVYRLRKLIKEGTEGFPVVELNFQVITVGLSDVMLAEFYRILSGEVEKIVESHALLPEKTVFRSDLRYVKGEISDALWQKIRHEKLRTGRIF